eukprot:5141432-Pyramimonas_sp.AAC.1
MSVNSVCSDASQLTAQTWSASTANSPCQHPSFKGESTGVGSKGEGKAHGPPGEKGEKPKLTRAERREIQE